MRVTSLLHMCGLDLRLGCDLPGRKNPVVSSIKVEQREVSSSSLDKKRVEELALKTLKISTLACRIELLSRPDQLQRVPKLKLLMSEIESDFQKAPFLLQQTIAQVRIRALEVIRKAEGAPISAVEEKVEKLEAYCRSDKNYGQREFAWIQVNTPLLISESDCIKEWRSAINHISSYQAEVRKQFAGVQKELASVMTMEMESEDLQTRVSMLFRLIPQSIAETEKAIENLEKAMDAFEEIYPQFRQTREEVARKK